MAEPSLARLCLSILENLLRRGRRGAGDRVSAGANYARNGRGDTTLIAPGLRAETGRGRRHKREGGPDARQRAQQLVVALVLLALSLLVGVGVRVAELRDKQQLVWEAAAVLDEAQPAGWSHHLLFRNPIAVDPDPIRRAAGGI